ncbi:21033_t:CDS:2 [Cetraspora pellucida]|uniref:21033_t:CDS:1 n=1 Tax=Cetraspora pellucida TaxID=1433469 RepID=A0A9N9I3L5_9GLOM|nr:21033_t:CDS:2 [Cetraspora pellucida]
MNGKDCRRCLALLSQIEQKDAIIEKYRKITKYQSDLIQDLSNGGNLDLTPPIISYDNEFLAVTTRSTVVSSSFYRIYIGPLTDDIDKETLKQSLEASFGPVDSLDFIPGKSCAFANFSSPTAFNNAIKEGVIIVKDHMLSVEQAKKPPRSRTNRKKVIV